jgi:DNA repair protein RecN (Recombination protein N)
VIEELRISGLGVIEGAVLPLGPGLTVVTGETGAGKTMVVTALGLLLGGRADTGAVRAGERSARIEGLVGTGSAPAFAAAVDAAGGVVEEDSVVLARTIAAEGRSRAFVGGAAVPVATLAATTEPLVAVHGQSDQHRLLRPQAQREAVDRFAGDTVRALRADYEEAHARLGAVEAELRELVGQARERAREADLLRFGLGEIEAVSPARGEDVDLAAEEGRLGHADTLRTAAENAREALSSEQGSPDALAAVSAARGLLDGVRDHDPEAAGLADRLAELTYLLSDLAADVASYASSVDTDPARLAAVSERRAALTALLRKYGDTVDDVLAWSGASAARLAGLEHSDERIEELRALRRRLLAELARLAGGLSDARSRAAAELAERVTQEVRALAMPHATLTVTVTQHEADDGAPALEVGGRRLRFTGTGVDEVELLLAANPGAEPRSLTRSASGGELSRVMLALEVVLAGGGEVPTFVFDEVDAGVGGKAAIEVGARLARLARTAQVLVVTHLPQVAAYADRHVVVEKSSDGTVTTSGLTVLDDEGRLRELSRMLAGVEESETALAHAQELLASAQERLRA